MKTFLADVKPGDNIEDFFLLKSIVIRTANNGNKYADLVLADKTGEMVTKIWDLNKDVLPVVDALEEKEIVKIRGVVNEWNGARQLKVLRIRKRNDADVVEISDFIKASPLPGQEMFQQVMNVAEEIEDEDYRKIAVTLLSRNQEKLLYFPAASKNHHAEMGGLLYHVLRMLRNAAAMCQVYTILKPDLLKCGVILHDIAKLDEIDADQYGMADSYTFEGQMLGHIVQGIKIIDRVSEELEIPREKQILLEHMLLSHHYEPEFGSPKKPLFAEAEMLHYLDIIDARIYDMENALKNVPAGEFTDRVWTMDNRRLYKPTELEAESVQ